MYILVKDCFEVDQNIVIAITHGHYFESYLALEWQTYMH